MPSVRKIIIVVIAVQSAMGFFFLFYGSVYSVVNTRKADEMIEYVKEINPGYYEMIISGDNETIRRDFYKNFTEHGNRSLLLVGIFFMMIAVNVSVPFLYFEAKRLIVLRNNTEIEEAATEGTQDEPADGEVVQTF